MPSTLDAGFREFEKRIRTSPSEAAAAQTHRKSILDKLEAAFGATGLFRSGSFGSGTNVRKYSDVDYFAIIPSYRLPFDSSVALANLASSFRSRYPLTSGIRVNGPAVRLPFGIDGAEATEVVPVYERGETLLGFREFGMPNGSGGWMFSSPESHNRYVTLIDDCNDHRLKPLIRFVKVWKYSRSVPINSFYLEMFVTAYAAAHSLTSYDRDLLSIFDSLFENGLSAIIDPRFPDDGRYLNPTNTDLQKVEALKAIERVRSQALRARVFEEIGDTRASFDWWSGVFNEAFPAYGEYGVYY